MGVIPRDFSDPDSVANGHNKIISDASIPSCMFSSKNLSYISFRLYCYLKPTYHC